MAYSEFSLCPFRTMEYISNHHSISIGTFLTMMSQIESFNTSYNTPLYENKQFEKQYNDYSATQIVEYQATIRPTIRPRIIVEYRIFLE